MDDADLEKLVVKPGKLKPKFNRSTIEYELVLNSGIKEFSLDLFTRDSSASWTIPGRGTERVIKFTEGSIFDLCVEVTAEDGSTIKTYTISVTSLAANSTYIGSLKVKNQQISPIFKQNVLNYEVIVPSSCTYIEVSAIAPDKNTKLEIQPINSEDGNDKNNIKLNFGKTVACITVTSPDSTASLCYTIVARRDVFLFPLELKLRNTADENFKCGICLNVAHCAVKSGGFWFCQMCLHTVTRVNKKHPFTNRPIKMEDDVVRSKQNEESDISRLLVLCLCGNEVELGDLVDHLKKDCQKKLYEDEKTSIVVSKDKENLFETEACSSCSRSYFKVEKLFHNTIICSSKHSTTDNKNFANHKFDGTTSSKWEKKLQDEMVRQSFDNAMDEATKLELQINEMLNKKQIDRTIVEFMHRTCQYYAHEIHTNKKNHQAHYKLGVMLEYLFLMEDAFQFKIKNDALKHPDNNNNSSDGGEFQTDESMQDDICALSEMRGYGRNATTTHQLQALDHEYHQLLEQGQSEKADYVQKLYAFKQRQQHAAGKPDLHLQSLNNQSNLHKALQKYQDACVVDGNVTPVYHIAAGRLLLVMGRVEDALTRLRCAVALKPTNCEARFLFGIAMASAGTFKKDHGKEIKMFLTQGVNDILLKQITSPPTNGIEGLRNTLQLDGISLLSRMTDDGDIWNSPFLLRLIVGRSLLNMSRVTNRNGKTFKKNQSAFLQGQLRYGLWSKESKNTDKNALKNFWKNLSNLTIVFCGNESMEILCIQKKICEELVTLLPRSGEALSNYATVLASFYELSPKDVQLRDVENLFRASLEVEGINMYKDQGTPPKYLVETSFWKKLNNNETNNNNTTSATKNITNAAEGTVANKQPTLNRKNVPGNKTPAVATKNQQTRPARGAPGQHSKTAPGPSTTNRVSPGRAAAASGLKTSPAPSSSSRVSPKKHAAPVARTSTMKASGLSKPLPSITRSKTDARKKSSEKCCVAKNSSTGTAIKTSSLSTRNNSNGVTPPTTNTIGQPQKQEINKPNPQARLGLARLLKLQQTDSTQVSSSSSETSSKSAEIENLYHEVIKMAPSLHDAYIELGEMLASTKPFDAIEVYCQFPFLVETPTENEVTQDDPNGFDDGYLYGEIVRLLMKEECYEDPRLEKFMIKLGQVLGFSTLDKYVSILESKLKYNKLLCSVYAGVNRKSVDDPDLKQFFRFKCWQ